MKVVLSLVNTLLLLTFRVRKWQHFLDNKMHWSLCLSCQEVNGVLPISHNRSPHFIAHHTVQKFNFNGVVPFTLPYCLIIWGNVCEPEEQTLSFIVHALKYG